MAGFGSRDGALHGQLSTISSASLRKEFSHRQHEIFVCLRPPYNPAKFGTSTPISRWVTKAFLWLMIIFDRVLDGNDEPSSRSSLIC